MSLLSYKVLHMLGVFVLFIALGGLVALAERGGKKSALQSLSGALHGTALVLILLSGFGMLAQLGGGFPGWVIAKLVIWLVLGGALVLVKRMPQLGTVWLLVLPLLGAVAAYVALYKPF